MDLTPTAIISIRACDGGWYINYNYESITFHRICEPDKLEEALSRIAQGLIKETVLFPK